ncbi:MAG: hypothetical protein U1E76_09585 [Planctomycetota bacterium]
MKSPWLKLLALGGLFALLAPELLSHGGRFKPGLRGLGGAAPGGALPTAPPSGGGGTGNGPPPGTGELVPPNRTGWGSGGRTASPPKQGGTRTGGAVPTPGVAIPSAGQRAGRGAMTGSSRAQPTDDTDQWQQWWEFNKEPLLAQASPAARAYRIAGYGLERGQHRAAGACLANGRAQRDLAGAGGGARRG